MDAAEEVVRFLGGVSLFDGLPEPALAELAARGAVFEFHRGDVICRQGDPGVSLFVVASGLTEVVIEGSGEQRVLAHLHRGDYFGEMGVLAGLPRSATVRALADTRVFGLTKADFEEVCRRNVQIALDVIRTLSLRLARTNATGVRATTARVVVLLSTEQGLGRTTLAANLAVALVAEGAGTVALYDPQLSCPALAGLFGCAGTADLAGQLLTAGHLDLEQVALRPRPGLLLLAPQSRGGQNLQEFHQHLPFEALREGSDVVVTDSTSTLVGLNRELIRSAAAVLLLLPATGDVAATVGQIERMVLGPAGVPASLLRPVLVHRGPGPSPQVPDGAVVLPPAPTGAGLAVEGDPAGPYARAVKGLAAALLAGSRVELFVPLVAGGPDEAAVVRVVAAVAAGCPELGAAAGVAGRLPDGRATGSYVVVRAALAERERHERLGAVVRGACEVKDRLGLPAVHLSVAGAVQDL